MIFKDQINHEITLIKRPKRIISLVPSQTELLYDLGVIEEVVGITKFCVHPQSWYREKKRVGGTKNVNFDKVEALQPDLIIANKEENQKDQIEKLQQDYPVWTSDIATLEQSLDMISEIGKITNRKKNALKIIEEIKVAFQTLPLNQMGTTSVVYLIWKNPYMTVGADTFIHEMLLRCGLTNIAKGLRYPIISEDELIEKQPDIILLSSEPYPFKERDLIELEKICPQSKILLVDGELFSWYGSRLKYAPTYFIDLINKIS